MDGGIQCTEAGQTILMVRGIERSSTHSYSHIYSFWTSRVETTKRICGSKIGVSLRREFVLSSFILQGGLFCFAAPKWLLAAETTTSRRGIVTCFQSGGDSADNYTDACMALHAIRKIS
ncbi:uncharacterized protein LOC143209221 [Lasioglossum baleicum]|uniref:uncharacterized protein LOC143209221 n=1 Tax=Lasioglossum baleicum TaxID=434251 RepID=UPI003FCC6193